MLTFIQRTWGLAVLAGLSLAAIGSADDSPFKVPKIDLKAKGSGKAYANAPGKGGFNIPALAKKVAAVGPSNPFNMLLNNPYGMGRMTSNQANQPVGGGYPWYGNNYPDPYGGYLRGAADVIKAQGQYLLDTQEAYLLKEDVRKAMLDNRRRRLDYYLYRKSVLPTLEDQREQLLAEEVRRSLNSPPPTEVWSGKALNILLVNSRKLEASAKAGDLPNIPVEEDILKKINVTSGKNGSNIGVFKNEGKLAWPIALADLKAADEIRDQMQQLSTKAFDDALKGNVDAGTLKEMNAISTALQRMLVGNVASIPFAQYSSAKRFLNQLDNGIKALERPDARNYVNGRYALKGRTVAEVLKYMNENGLVFAPATAGEEAAYRAIHIALAAYERATNKMVADR